MEFKNRIVLVTGGSSGIGLACATLLVQRGAHVWLLARDRQRLEQAKEQLVAQRVDPNQKVETVSVDVADHLLVKQSLQAILQSAGCPDMVINSAGVTRPGEFLELDDEVFRYMMDVNYFGTLNVIREVLPGMVERHSGYIVNISSLAGVIGIYGYSAYGASKFAVRGLSDVLRSELKPLGIHLSVVFPPDVDTPQLAYDNLYKPAVTKALVSGNSKALTTEQVAKTILHDVERGRYIILPGFDSKFYYWFSNVLGKNGYPVMDLYLARAWKSVKNGKNGAE